MIDLRAKGVREAVVEEMACFSNSPEWPLKPQKITWDPRSVMAEESIAVCDAGVYKMWMARFFRCKLPNTCITSNGFASMSIAVPGWLFQIRLL